MRKWECASGSMQAASRNRDKRPCRKCARGAEVVRADVRTRLGQQAVAHGTREGLLEAHLSHSMQHTPCTWVAAMGSAASAKRRRGRGVRWASIQGAREVPPMTWRPYSTWSGWRQGCMFPRPSCVPSAASKTKEGRRLHYLGRRPPFQGPARRSHPLRALPAREQVPTDNVFHLVRFLSAFGRMLITSSVNKVRKEHDMQKVRR
jgi:hypothetical protein